MNQNHKKNVDGDFKIGRWLVQPRAGFISSGKRSTRLEPKVMGVLLVLANEAGQVVSRQDLLDEVWPGQVVTDDSLTTVISTLRRQLGDDSRNNRFIETVPKRGYRLIATVEPCKPGNMTFESGLNHRLISAAGLLIAALLLLVLLRSPGEQTPAPTHSGSIAVLPFDTFGDDPQLSAFADGLAEELIHQISADARLKVTSRTSSFKFRDRDDDVIEIGQRLGVQNLIEGSVRSGEGVLRVTVQLIDTREDEHIWSRVFDVAQGDVVAMQEKVSYEVVTLLSGSREANMLQTRIRHPVPSDAYRLYLLGESYMRVNTVESYEKAAANFADAIHIAPDYPIALTRYAAARMLLHQYRKDDLTEATSAAQQALGHASSIDPELPEIYAVYGLVYTYNRDFSTAEDYFLAALEKRPNMTFALHNYAFMLWGQGRLTEATSPLRKLLELNPLSGGTYFLLGDSLGGLGRFQEARNTYEQCNKKVPNTRSCLMGLAAVERIMGNLTAAERLAAATASLVPEDYPYLMTTRLALALYRGDLREAESFYQAARGAAFQEAFLLRTQVFRAQAIDNINGFLAELNVMRESAVRAGQSTASLDWIEAHAHYLLGDCSQALDLYEVLLEGSSDELSDFWTPEFGMNHLTNVLYCQRKTERRFFQEHLDEIRQVIVNTEEFKDYPAGLFLLAKIHRLDGDIAGSNAALSRLEALDWPFFWLVDSDPVLAGSFR